jgi:hypothetical protein
MERRLSNGSYIRILDWLRCEKHDFGRVAVDGVVRHLSNTPKSVYARTINDEALIITSGREIWLSCSNNLAEEFYKKGILERPKPQGQSPQLMFDSNILDSIPPKSQPVKQLSEIDQVVQQDMQQSDFECATV